MTPFSLFAPVISIRVRAWLNFVPKDFLCPLDGPRSSWGRNSAVNMKSVVLLAALALCVSCFEASGATLTKSSPRQQELLDEMLRRFPKSEPWEQWLKRTGELPPDFDALPSIPFLPDPLRFQNGAEVKRSDWPGRRQELLGLFQNYVLGTFPPSPGNVRPADIKSREEDGALIDAVTLEFGPNHAAKLHLELILPKGQAPPFPVFLTQDTHRS
jgi:hypothetical protein